MANHFEILFDADSFVPPTTNAPDRGMVQDRTFLAFDADTKQTAISKAITLPATYTGAGTLKANIAYIMESATSGTVDFEVAVEAITSGDTTDLDAASSFDTANAASETVPATAGYLSVMTVTLANKNSVALGDSVRMSLARDATDATNDTATGAARVLWVSLFEEA